MKRADLDTRTVLQAVRQGAPYNTLNTRYPTKVITAALERELHAGHIDYGTSLSSPWLTTKGQTHLEQNTTATGYSFFLCGHHAKKPNTKGPRDRYGRLK